MSDLREECGVFGVFAPEGAHVSSLTYYGLYALQHRGQESCGIVVNDDGVFRSYKDNGLVNDVFTPARLTEHPDEIIRSRYDTKISESKPQWTKREQKNKD